MLLLEHQGKTLLRRFGLATPAGTVVSDEAALLDAMADGRPKVLKAQVAAGGRGKAGGIVKVGTVEEARAAFARLRELSIAGHTSRSVLVEDVVAYDRERYAGLQIDNGRLLLSFAARGGVDVETITEHDPGNFRSFEIDVASGPDLQALEETFAALALPVSVWSAYAAVGHKLFALARASDAVTVEINPLVETPDGGLMVLDARIFLDELALGRQPELAALRSTDEAPALSGAAMPSPSFKRNPAGGEIGLIGFGSGLNITFMDWIATIGGRVGTLVDIDAMVTGGHARSGFAAAFEQMDRDPQIRSMLLCIISCGNRMDDVVRAMIEAGRERGPLAKPLVLHLRGNRMRFAQPLLDEAGLTNSRSLLAAVTEVVEASRSGGP